MATSIKHRFVFQQKPEVVWEYLTKAELISQWLMENDFQPIAGHEFKFRTKPMAKIDFDGIIYCRVLEIVPYKKLCYSWKSGPGNGRISLDSVVLWTLVEKDKGTELSLEHSGFREIENFTIRSLMDEGWLKNIQKIAERINSAKHDPTNT